MSDDARVPLPDVLVLCYHGLSKTWPAITGRDVQCLQ